MSLSDTLSSRGTLPTLPITIRSTSVVSLGDYMTLLIIIIIIDIATRPLFGPCERSHNTGDQTLISRIHNSLPNKRVYSPPHFPHQWSPSVTKHKILSVNNSFPPQLQRE